MIIVPLIFLLLLVTLAVMVLLALVGFAIGRGRARHYERSKSHGLLRTGVVLAILMFLMIGLFTSRLSQQRETATVSRNVAMETKLSSRHDAQRNSIITVSANVSDEHPAKAAIDTSDDTFASREGAPPEPLEESVPASAEPTFAEAMSVEPDVAVTESLSGIMAESKITSLTPLADRPVWLGETPKRFSPVYRTVVVSDPYVTRQECEEALEPQLREVAERYVDDLLGEDARRFVDLDMETIRGRIARDEFVELLGSSVGPMQRVHVLMEFDDPLRAEFRQQYQDGIRERRLYQAGGGAVLFVAVLGVIFGYLTLDTATRGFYTGRLQLAATAAILMIVFLGISLGRAI